VLRANEAADAGALPLNPEQGTLRAFAETDPTYDDS
jgi:hypothetical protein